ncbi:mannose-ethanolamine phosphotransferase gpi13 [Agyrium rufum]|nr:mannose-ethanolamine phosphotransferase gpi13 [Agyrium rufum]
MSEAKQTGQNEFKSISAAWAAAKEKNNAVQKQAQTPTQPSNSRKPLDEAIEGKYNVLHLKSVVFPLIFFFFHAYGIYVFTTGFLLTRLVLEDKSTCDQPPLTVAGFTPGSHERGCWHPKTFEKAVVVIIDALRYDFTVPGQGEPRHWHNALRVFHETAVAEPYNAFLLPFIADPPTTTLVRLKGLTTGNLPTFIDAGSNFAGTAIEEDNLVAQLLHHNRTMVHLGDDTWQALFPGYFDANLTRAYDSFNVWDLHTLDNGVTEHLFPLLEPANRTKWDVVFAHYLGVDHAGHRYGPDHPAMTAKLQQMDDVFRKVIQSIDDDTLLVVMGDHGMDAKGDHGGESDDEIEAAIWMYSRKGAFGRTRPDHLTPPRTAKGRSVDQIDLVPTLSLLLGLPIPFNNLGTPIQEAFIGRDSRDFGNLATVNAITATQVRDYQQKYSIARGEDAADMSGLRLLWDDAQASWDALSEKPDVEALKQVFSKFMAYQRNTLTMCRYLWARFDLFNMGLGIASLTVSLICLYCFAMVPGPLMETHISIKLFPIAKCLSAGIATTILISLMGITTSLWSLKEAGLLGATGSCAVAFWFTHTDSQIVPKLYPNSLWGWQALIFTLLPAIGFASNSFTIWEDEILLFFLGTFGFLAVVSSIRKAVFTDSVIGVSQSLLFLVITRLASLSRLCREEQMPFCHSTYYASATSSTSAEWQLFIPFAMTVFLPTIIKSYYHGTKSYEGSAIFWIGFAFRMGLLGSTVFWVINAADDGNWLAVEEATLKVSRNAIALIVYGTAFVAGTTTFYYCDPCVNLVTVGTDDDNPNDPTRRKVVTILGYANTHGSRYFLVVTNWILAIALVQKPMGAGAIGLLTWQILALLEIVDANDLSQSVIGPIVLGLLGNFYFFKTGHQATLASIQWDSAFVGLTKITYPWSPLLVVLNTFGAQILVAVSVPLVALWKQPPKKKGLLGGVVKALAVFMLYHATINLATTMWAGWLRRHLMLYRIFSPRFMTGAAVLLIVDVVGIVVGLGAVRWNTVSVGQAFGWP